MLDTDASRRLALFFPTLIAVLGACLLLFVSRGNRDTGRRAQNIRLIAELLMYVSWTVLLSFWLLWDLAAYPLSRSGVQGSDPALSILTVVVAPLLLAAAFFAIILSLGILLAGGKAQRIRLLAAVASCLLFLLLGRGMAERIRIRDLVSCVGMLMTPIVALVQSYRRRVVAF